MRRMIPKTPYIPEVSMQPRPPGLTNFNRLLRLRTGTTASMVVRAQSPHKRKGNKNHEEIFSIDDRGRDGSRNGVCRSERPQDGGEARGQVGRHHESLQKASQENQEERQEGCRFHRSHDSRSRYDSCSREVTSFAMFGRLARPAKRSEERRVGKECRRGG